MKRIKMGRLDTLQKLVFVWIALWQQPFAHGFVPAFLTRPVNQQLSTTRRLISSGLTFEDGNQILVSVQKPLGIILEQDSDGNTDNSSSPLIRIVDIDPSGSGAAAGLRIGDVLVAVQNADMVDRDLEYAMQFIAQAPKVLNLRFIRRPEENED